MVIKISQKSTRFLLSFFTLIFFFISLRFSFDTLLNPSRNFRSFGRTQHSRRISSNFFMTCLRFCSCVLYSWLEILKYPSLLIRLASLVSNRCWTSRGRKDAVGTWKRSSTLVLTLLTFWPPAPEAREKVMDSWSSGMWILSGTVHGVVVVVDDDDENVRERGVVVLL